MGIATVAEMKPSMSGKRLFRPSSSSKHANEWPIYYVSSDLTIEVGTTSFALHKSALVSRSGRIRKLLVEAKDSKISRLNFSSVPGGSQAFELAEKFCYGVSFEITTSNVAMLRCAAHFLEMTNEFSEKSLEARTEGYLRGIVLSNIQNSIYVLHRCESLLPISEEINLISRIIDSISNNACKEQLASGLSKLEHNFPSNSDPETTINWWGKSHTILNLDLFQRFLSAVKTKGLKQDTICRILIKYAQNSIHGLGVKDSQPVKGNLLNLDFQKKQRLVIETVVGLLPSQTRKSTVPMTFLSSLLKSAAAAEASTSCKTDLERRII